ncbi:DUF6518 family protein [Cellulomonas sp. NPDC057328]|uniref:DUF6518 family protein n=1 Tax=Cellulomonas sp. NPDC057328 TaxID=3346101 RepID=UPI003629097C
MTSPSVPLARARTDAPAVAGPVRSARARLAPAFGRTLLAVAAGLVAGSFTSFGQTVLDAPFQGLANAVSPWLVVPFAVGATALGRRSAALLGLLACLAQVPGYYVTAALRGFPVGTSWLVVWAVCGVLGGVVLGLAGHSWWRGGDRERGIGAALLAAAWLAEAVVTYAVVLRYPGDAVVFAVVGALVVGVLGVHRRQHLLVLTWLAPALLLASLGFLALHRV